MLQDDLIKNEMLELESDDQLSDVKTKHHTPEGLFTQDSQHIVDGLLKDANNDEELALKRINFYINRAGDGLSNKTNVNSAKKELEKRVNDKKEKAEIKELARSLFDEYGSITKRTFNNDFLSTGKQDRVEEEIAVSKGTDPEEVVEEKYPHTLWDSEIISIDDNKSLVKFTRLKGSYVSDNYYEGVSNLFYDPSTPIEQKIEIIKNLSDKEIKTKVENYIFKQYPEKLWKTRLIDIIKFTNNNDEKRILNKLLKYYQDDITKIKPEEVNDYIKSYVGIYAIVSRTNKPLIRFEDKIIYSKDITPDEAIKNKLGYLYNVVEPEITSIDEDIVAVKFTRLKEPKTESIDFVDITNLPKGQTIEDLIHEKYPEDEYTINLTKIKNIGDKTLQYFKWYKRLKGNNELLQPLVTYIPKLNSLKSDPSRTSYVRQFDAQYSGITNQTPQEKAQKLIEYGIDPVIANQNFIFNFFTKDTPDVTKVKLKAFIYDRSIEGGTGQSFPRFILDAGKESRYGDSYISVDPRYLKALFSNQNKRTRENQDLLQHFKDEHPKTDQNILLNQYNNDVDDLNIASEQERKDKIDAGNYFKLKYYPIYNKLGKDKQLKFIKFILDSDDLFNVHNKLNKVIAKIEKDPQVLEDIVTDIDSALNNESVWNSFIYWL